MADSSRLFVGIDWATAEHQVCALDPSGKLLGEKSFEHTGEGLTELVTWLEKIGGGSLEGVSVSIETTHGAVVETLIERGARVFSINPKQLDRFRDRFSPAGAKDDRRDARVLADSLRTDMKAFRLIALPPESIVLLREWSRMYDEIVEDVVRQTNRFREQLTRYYPQILRLGEPDQLWVLEIWRLIQTPAAAPCTRLASIGRILRRHRVQRFNAKEVRDILGAKPFVSAPGTLEAATTHARFAVEQLELLVPKRNECKRKLSKLLKTPATEATAEGEEIEQRDAAIIQSIPGVGTIVASTLLSEAHDALQRRDYHSLRTLSGVAPVTRQSGKTKAVAMRRACNLRLRNACYHWARVAMQWDPCLKEKYHRHRTNGRDHGTTLRILADYLLKVLCSMLRKRTLYDPRRNEGRLSAA